MNRGARRPREGPARTRGRIMPVSPCRDGAGTPLRPLVLPRPAPMAVVGLVSTDHGHPPISGIHRSREGGRSGCHLRSGARPCPGLGRHAPVALPALPLLREFLGTLGAARDVKMPPSAVGQPWQGCTKAMGSAPRDPDPVGSWESIPPWWRRAGAAGHVGELRVLRSGLTGLSGVALPGLVGSGRPRCSVP